MTTAQVLEWGPSHFVLNWTKYDAIKSSSRCEGALEKEWYELVGSEMCAAGTFLGSCFQEVYLTATINALASTSDVPIRVLKVPPAR